MSALFFCVLQLRGRCMVIEDSLIGLKAALGAKMNCVITYTGSTESQVREGEI